MLTECIKKWPIVFPLLHWFHSKNKDTVPLVIILDINPLLISQHALCVTNLSQLLHPHILCRPFSNIVCMHSHSTSVGVLLHVQQCMIEPLSSVSEIQVQQQYSLDDKKQMLQLHFIMTVSIQHYTESKNSKVKPRDW